MCSGSKQPALIGTSGKTCLMARYTAAFVVAITLFIGPLHGGEEPLMSNASAACSASPPPVLVMRMAIFSGSSTTPSESTKASPS